jgi:hypothetical protein
MRPTITKRDIKYSNKDFAEFRKALIEYTKNYFPNTYQDFNESSPGMHFIELCSYVGDVLSYYSDIQLQESFLYTVNEKINLYNLAQSLGYKPRTITPSQVDLDIMQLLPAIGEGTETKPDWNYALVIESNMQVSSDNEFYFRTINPVDFRFSSSFDPTEISIHSEYPDGSIEYYIIKKTVKAVAGEIRTEEFEFGESKVYDKIVLNDPNISEVISVTDSDSNIWREVPFLAQDLVPVAMRNIPYYDKTLSKYRLSTPYILSYEQTDKRFITRLRKDDRTEIQFGSGLSYESDEEIVPNPYNIAIGLDYFKRVEDVSIDPMNFLYTKTYGQTPSNTVLTVKYSLANGMNENIRSNTINIINEISIINPFEVTDPVTLQSIRDSITVNNPNPAYGGMDKKPLDIIREEAMAHFAAQNRAVTKEDYILRCYTMPAKFGSVAKVYIEEDTQITSWNAIDKVPNKFSLNLYTVSYDGNRNFVQSDLALKENLRQYIAQYRLMTDAINIKDTFIINIGLEVEVVSRPDYNSNEVSLLCIDKLIELLSPDRMEICQPLYVNKLYTELDKLEGVQTVQNIRVVNLFDTNLGYSGVVYDLDLALRSGIIYPSLDPAIFEVKYPKSDIKVSIIDL